MATKLYKNEDVCTAAMHRLDFIFSEFENIFVSFSGGKDSGLLLQLVMQYMEDRGIHRTIGMFHQDFEAQYTATTEYVTDMFRAMEGRTEQYWSCLPMAVRSAVSTYDPWWYPWDDEKQDIWCRDMPQHPAVVNLDHNIFDFYTYKMPEKELSKKFGAWYRDKHGGGKTVCLLGLRADESLQRYSAIINKKFDYEGKRWIAREMKNVWTASPLYDWTVEDVWTAYGKFGFKYNHLYDLYYKAGVPLSQMRVASPFIEYGTSALGIYRVVDPKIWVKICGRVAGANFASIYGQTKAMGYRQITLPPGHTWKSYTMFLLSTLPENIRRNYEEKFRFSDKFWHTTGGGFAEDVIREIEEHGYPIRRNGVSNYTKDGKSRIVWDGEIPDDTDDVTSTKDIPSWKRMCYCILKNDILCRTMGFGPNKEQQKRINDLKAKYRAVIHGGV